MKKNILALLMLILIGSSCSTEIPVDAGGQEIYSALCTRCHSSDLSGGVGPALGAGSDLAGQPDAYLTQSITSGLGRMPAFRSTLTAEQIQRVVEFLRANQAGT